MGVPSSISSLLASMFASLILITSTTDIPIGSGPMDEQVLNTPISLAWCPGSRGGTVLSHAHNVDSTLELREEISGDECALDEKDAIVTHARLLSEKRISLLILASGLALYMAGLVVGTSKNFVGMVVFSAGMLALGLGAAALWIKVGTKRVSWQTRQAARSEDAEISDQ